MGRINIVKMALLPKAILHVQCNSHQNPKTFITEIEKSTLKFIWKHKRLWIAKAILSKKSNAGGITIPDFKLYYRPIAIKKSMVLAQKQIWRPVKQNREPVYESTQLHPTYFWQGAKNIMMEKRQPLQQMLLGKVVICLQLDPFLSPCASINPKWIKDLNIWPKTLKLV
jgi:hypothetical protein